MSANKVDKVPNLTFVSMTGPRLDNISTKAMRAHTTRANFARRRGRLVREYADQKERAARVEALQVEKPGQTADHDQVVDLWLPIFNHHGLDQKLNKKDAFLINNLTQAMGKLHSITNIIPASETAASLTKSDWACFLFDPTMLDVSLYFARHVYEARLQDHAIQFVLDTYKDKALRSVRERLNDESNGLSDSLVAAVLLLTLLHQGIGNIEAWKIHVSGLFQIITVRSRYSKDPPAYWMSHAIPRTIMQGLLLFTRHDMTLLATIEKTGVFDTMFSGPTKRVAYLILANAEQIAAWQHTCVRSKQLSTSDHLNLRRIMKSLDTAVHLNRIGYTGKAFLTAKALSIRLFLEIVLRSTTNTEEDFGNTAVQLMEVLQKPEEQLSSSLALCSSLHSSFWQTMMGAIAAPDARTKFFYTSRLGRIITALALTSWQDALVVLRRIFWIPWIFAAPCHQILSEVVYSQSCIDL